MRSQMNACRSGCRQGLSGAIDRSETTRSVVKRSHKFHIAGKVEDNHLERTWYQHIFIFSRDTYSSFHLSSHYSDT